MNETTPKEATTSERYIEVLTELIELIKNLAECNQRIYDVVERLVKFNPCREKVNKKPLVPGQSLAKAYENIVNRLEKEIELAISNLED